MQFRTDSFPIFVRSSNIYVKSILITKIKVFQYFRYIFLFYFSLLRISTADGLHLLILINKETN